MANSAVPDQLSSSQKPIDLDLHCLQRQAISWFSRIRANLGRDLDKYQQLHVKLQIKVVSRKLFFFFLHENLCCGYSLEKPRFSQ